MKTNLDKWNYYMSILNNKTTEFIMSQSKDKEIPTIYYVVLPNGKIVERTIVGVDYSHYKNNVKTYFSGKKPTNKEVSQLAEYSNSDISFTKNNIFFKYSQIFGGGGENEIKSYSFVNFSDVLDENNLFHSFKDAEKVSKKIVEENDYIKDFKEKHKKDINYNYKLIGYRFLGWQNGWKHEYYDEDGKLCEETKKPSVYFGYSKDKYPEYRNCIDSKHLRIEVNHNQRGTENTVSCPICKIYWKYDSSD